ncbi:MULTISPECIES: transcription termination factor NusA [Hydrocarboniphaga]|uniref:Transcription termination/antitermination protein NusA n=1 Tax=Hydrocarboniphaga effusa AP103 TaxID=1172194 RepID=I7Z9A5_9GAMM|nr:MULTISPECIES: transcription termination factor NusA [Hydrocarboniphaga]EIT68414.1 transcription elongation factor NusA [Hydrocarboniphaga effusa AP103]MDZ4078598.1 transcription termination factor NusA [Hydrocarboniphaga sp.]
MNKNILLMADVVSNEKGVDKDTIFAALEAALASATKERYGDEADVRVSIDQNTGDYESYRRWTVYEDDSEDFEFPERQIKLTYARKDYPSIEPGEVIEQKIESIDFGRIGAQRAKQVIVQKVREAERAQVVEAYKHRIGELLTGLVKRLERGAVIVDLGGTAEAIIPREHMIPREPARPGDRIRGYLFEVGPQVRGPQLFMSRTLPQFLMELFKLEVPEIAQGLIELKGAARDPGLRAKIAVQAKDKRIDPVGACVGMRGSRVQSVSNELAGERVDIVPWDENPAQFVINAMAPAEVENVVIDEDAHSMSIGVIEEKLAQAIGRGGQNVRLASELTGWTLNVMTTGELESKKDEENKGILEVFMKELDVDEELAGVLVDEGFTSLEEVAYVPPEELLQIEEFDESIVEELRNRARDVLLTKAIAKAEQAASVKPGDDLLSVDGMDEETAYRLAEAGILTAENLADLATDELLETVELDEARAQALIMAARQKLYA